MSINRLSLDYLQTSSAHHKGSSVHRSVSSTVGNLSTLRVKHLDGFLPFQVFSFYFSRFFCFLFFFVQKACGKSKMVFRKEPSATEEIQLPYQSSKTLSLVDPLSSLNKTYRLGMIVGASANICFSTLS